MKFIERKCITGSDYLKIQMKSCWFSAIMLAGRCGIFVSAMQSYMAGRRSLQKCEAGALFQMAYRWPMNLTLIRANLRLVARWSCGNGMME